LPTLGQAFRLEFTSPWNKAGESEQVWSVKFHTTGEGMSSQSEADEHALAFADLILGAVNAETSFTRYIHYPVNSVINDYLADYATGDHPGTNSAYTTTPDTWAQLEVCHLWRCPAGKNTKGRSKYLFKYIHSAPTAGDTLEQASDHAIYTGGYLDTLTTGVGPNMLVATLPDGTVPPSEWEIADRLYTRQLRRGNPKPKS
jgi:hypothetical protein